MASRKKLRAPAAPRMLGFDALAEAFSWSLESEPKPSLRPLVLADALPDRCATRAF